MSQLYNSLSRISWALGIATMLGGVVLKVVPDLGKRVEATPHGIVIFAGVLFLCALATREIGGKATSGS